jgi:ubiquinone/menaquinone biosynthesis C-methylase UbiE
MSIHLSQQIYRDRYTFLLKHYQAGNILDIGNIGGVMGQGISNSFHTQFKSAVSPNSVIYGMDLVAPSVEIQDQFENQIVADIEQGIPFVDRFFNTVYMGQVLEHLKQPFFALNEVRRVLKDEGTFIFDVPNPYSLTRMAKYVLQKQESLGDPTHVCFFTPASVTKMMELSGFAIQEMATDWKEKFAWFPSTWRVGMGSHLLVATVKK